MILIDNLNILKSSYPDIWNQIKKFEDKQNRILTEIEETRNGGKTLAIKNSSKVRLSDQFHTHGITWPAAIARGIGYTLLQQTTVSQV